MTNINGYELFEDYSAKVSDDNEEFFKYFRENRDKMFSGGYVFRTEEILSDEDYEKLNILNKDSTEPFKLRLYILKGKERIGWSMGDQLNRETFYMRNTAIFEEYRNKGIYKNLLRVIKQILKEKGFQKITSSHIATNSPVIAAKLKAGFIITGFEISEMFGLFVNLTYNFNETRNKILRYRAGEIALCEELIQVLNKK